MDGINEGSSSDDQRLQVLNRYRVLSPTPNPTLDGLVRVAATLCDVPIAFVGFFDTEYQVIKASIGWQYARLPRQASLCTQTIAQKTLIILEDLQKHPDFRQHPLLELDPKIRFYAGVPLITTEGLAIGTLAILDRQPRKLNPDQQDSLLSLGGMVLTHLNEQKYVQELRQVQRQQEKRDVELQRHALIFAHIHDALLVLDLGGRIIDCNPGASQVFGWSKAELFGKTLQHLHPPMSETVRSLSVVKSILSDGGWQAQERFIRRDGSTGTAQINAVPLQSKGKQTIGILVIYHDISDRYLAELAWEQQKLALEQAQQVAQDANEAKGEFLAMMSHEIRTPMNAVIGMTDLLKETPLSPEQRDFVDTIHTAGESLLTIINQVLDFSKLESGSFKLDFYSFDVQEYVENVLDLLAAKALEKGLGLFYRIAENVPLLVEGDGNRVRQVLLNLLGNALKFTEQGEVMVDVSRVEPDSTTDPQAVMVQFAVRDTGIGIPPEQQAKIFKPYAQADVSTARNYGGTGLGLNISHRLTELMGGKIWLKSKVGKGSTFFFAIPLRPLDRSQLAGSAETPLVALNGKHVLIIDQNSTIQHFLSRQLEQWGMIPYRVSSWTEGINHLRRGDSIDIVLLDWELEKYGSFNLARQMHTLPNYSHLPIILLHSIEQENSSELNDLWPNQIEFTGRICKPIKPKALRNILLLACRSNTLVTVTPPPSTYDRTLGQKCPLRILLAEDNLINQKVINQILYRLGYTSTIVHNGYQVLQALEKEQYDLILMDLYMPELDGLETTRQVCELYTSDQRPRIVALTAHALASVEMECQEVGMNGYLTKPIRIPELIQVLQETAAQRCSIHLNGSPVSKPPIDIFGLQAFIRDLAGDDWNFLKDLVIAYLHDSDQYLAELVDYGQNPTAENQSIMQRIIHTLKSSSNSMFATTLGQLCQQFENEWFTYDRFQQNNAIEALQQEHKRVKAALHTFIDH